LDVHRPGVVVTKRGVYFNCGVGSERFLQCHGDIVCVFGHFFVCVVPYIMCRVVANPGDEFCLEFILVIGDEVEHTLQSLMWDITIVFAPRTGLIATIAGSLFRPVVTAADWEVAFGWSTNLVLKVNVWVRYLD